MKTFSLPDDAAPELQLSRDRHASSADGVCAMEFVSILAGASFSDYPNTACPVISSYVRTLNDNMPDDERQRLLPYLPRLLGTFSPARELQREQLLTLAAAQEFAAPALQANGFRHYAAYLRRFKATLGPIQSLVRIHGALLDLEEQTEPRSRLGLAAVSSYQAWRGLLVAFSERNPKLDLAPESDCGEWAGFSATNAHAAGAKGIWTAALGILDRLIACR